MPDSLSVLHNDIKYDQPNSDLTTGILKTVILCNVNFLVDAISFELNQQIMVFVRI